MTPLEKHMHTLAEVRRRIDVWCRDEHARQPIEFICEDLADYIDHECPELAPEPEA